MKLTNAFLKGLSVVIVLAIIKWLGDTFFPIWQPVLSMVYFDHVSFAFQWLLGVIFTIVSIIIIGYIVKVIAPAQKVFYSLPIIKILRKLRKPVVLVWYMGDWTLGLAMKYNAEVKVYKILLLTVPFPISGQLIFAFEENVQETGLLFNDLLGQLTSAGLHAILEQLISPFQEIRKRFRE